MASMNPLFSYTSLPMFNQINMELHGFSAMRQLIDNQNKSIDSYLINLEEDLKLNKSIEFKNVVDKLDEIEEPLDYANGIIYHLSSVNDCETIRKLKDDFRQELMEMNKKTSQSKVLYDSLKRIHTTQSEELRILDLMMKSMEKDGVNLEAEKQETLKTLDVALSKQSNKFSENLLDHVKSYKLVINEENYPTCKEFMKKTPLYLKEMYNSEDPENGPWTITLGGPSVHGALQFIHNESIRKKIYMDYIANVHEKNEPIINDILEMRQQESELLGFSNYAELSLSFKMAPNVETIMKMLDDLQAIALPKAIKEFKEIENYAKKETNMESLEPWNIAFWFERLKEEKFDMTEEELKPYFSLENVLKELFRLSKELFNINIVQQSCVETWHEDVRFYEVYENEALVARFYLDPYVREENKKSGAWMDSCEDKNKALNKHIPVAYLVCNGSPPSKNKPSLMSFSDVETLFHEFGHGLQHMLTKVEYGYISGINNIEWDAVELPSQFMENWCYNQETLNNMALHYETGEKLPQLMYESLVNQKNFGAAMGMMRQISFSKIDLHLHHKWKEMKENNETIWTIQKHYFNDCTPYKKILEEDKFLTSFSHIFGGYAAGYYSYKWAEIMSADCFEAFEENAENKSQQGKLFRNTILAMGGSKPAMEVFKEFRNREPDVKALLKHNGLI